MEPFRVWIDEDTVYQGKWFGTIRMKLSEIVKIYGESIDKFAYDENFLLLENEKGLVLEFGELDDGFKDLLKVLQAQLNAPPEDWYGRAEMSARGELLLLWERPE